MPLLKGAPELGTKYDGAKPRWDLMPWGPAEEVVRVLTFGADKYSDDNWMHVQPAHKRYQAAAIRHIVAWAQGERLDPESGFHHLAHAVSCLLFLMWHDGVKGEG
tara:strand:- start:781 stop:1095 length:315 start_codon:yes stop_codon:yes gene_type:complete